MAQDEILNLLKKNGSLTSDEIADILKISRSAVNTASRSLHNQGDILVIFKEGKMFYAINKFFEKGQGA